jgi:hypothetical protein
MGKAPEDYDAFIKYHMDRGKSRKAADSYWNRRQQAIGVSPVVIPPKSSRTANVIDRVMPEQALTAPNFLGGEIHELRQMHRTNPAALKEARRVYLKNERANLKSRSKNEYLAKVLKQRKLEHIGTGAYLMGGGL